MVHTNPPSTLSQGGGCRTLSLGISADNNARGAGGPETMDLYVNVCVSEQEKERVTKCCKYLYISPYIHISNAFVTF